MNTRKVIKYAVAYSVGVYAFQRFTGKHLGLPSFLDPLGMMLGYPAPMVAALPAPAAGQAPAIVTAAQPLSTG